MLKLNTKKQYRESEMDCGCFFKTRFVYSQIQQDA